MSSSNLVSLSMLFCFTLLLQCAIGVDPLYHICSSSFNYSSGSLFYKNLNTLFKELGTKVPSTGFGQSSVGAPRQETVHGLALCRGDVSTADCETCVNAATAEIKNLCSNDKAAVIWYDACLLRYSNVNFLGTIDSENKFTLYNVQNVSDIKSFNERTRDFLSRLADEAYRSQKLFATAEMNVDKIDKLYGLVQCTRDLSGLQCKKCLDNVISELPSCCENRRGGRVLTGSCNFRYELYPFIVSKKKKNVVPAVPEHQSPAPIHQ